MTDRPRTLPDLRPQSQFREYYPKLFCFDSKQWHIHHRPRSSIAIFLVHLTLKVTDDDTRDKTRTNIILNRWRQQFLRPILRKIQPVTLLFRFADHFYSQNGAHKISIRVSRRRRRRKLLARRQFLKCCIVELCYSAVYRNGYLKR